MTGELDGHSDPCMLAPTTTRGRPLLVGFLSLMQFEHISNSLKFFLVC